jgi:hypothetical protein
MFEKFKRNKNESQNHSAAIPMGALAISGAMQPEIAPSTREADKETILQAVHRVSELQQAFLDEAVSKGMNRDQIAQAAKEAVSSRHLPRVVISMAFHGSGSTYAILHGEEVPADALDVRYVDDPATNSQSMYIQRSREGGRAPREPVADDPTAFYQEIVGMSPQSSDQELRNSAERLSAELEPFMPPAGQPNTPTQ